MPSANAGSTGSTCPMIWLTRRLDSLPPPAGKAFSAGSHGSTAYPADPISPVL